MAFFLLILILFGLVFHKEIGRLLFSFEYRHVIEEAIGPAEIDPRLVAALIYVESGFNPRALSKKGARGLMQLMPETGAWIAEQRGEPFNIDHLFNPKRNLELGIWYLKYLFREFNGDTVMILAAYNAGWVRVREWKKTDIWQGGINDLHRIPYPETRRYVARIFRVYQIYLYLYPGEKGPSKAFFHASDERPATRCKIVAPVLTDRSLRKL